MKELSIKEFKYGQITSEEAQSIPRGASSGSLNWLTKGSKIELRRGYNLVGETENEGSGRITGLGVGKKPNGDDILYRTRKRKIEWLDTSTNDWDELGSDTLPATVVASDALGEDISIEPYSNPTGPQIWLNSPNAGPHKIMTANPDNVTAMYVLGTNYKGYMRVKNGRMIVWKRAGNPGNTTDPFFSKLDVKADSDYTQISSEAVGSGLVAHFKLNDNAADTVVVDAIGTQNGVASGNTSTLTTTGKISSAFDFDGVDDYVNVAHHASQLLTSGFTLSAWIKASSDGETSGKIIDKSTGLTGHDGFTLYVDDQTGLGRRVGLRVNNGPVATSADLAIHLDGSAWDLVTVTVDDDALVTFYINGVQSGTPTTTGALSGITTTNDLRIGNRSGATDRSFDGLIDDVRIYNRALSAAEVLSIYNGGDGSEAVREYADILDFKAAGARRICFQVTATDTSETFVDNGDGTLTGTAGGTGTINYTTGGITLVFVAEPVGAVTATYRWADDSSGGIADFGYSATRVATEGFILKQALGGDFQNLASLNGVEYCLHKTASWAVQIANDDLDVSNHIFRSKVGIPNHRAMVETGDGIYYIDDTDENDPHFKLLTLETQSSEVIPKSVSKQFKLNDIKVGVDLSGYVFDKGASIEFGDLILFACRTKDSETNNRVFVYNKTNKATDVLDYFVSCFAIYDGNLVAGDSVADNVYTLFSGTDDNQSQIANYWDSSLDNMGYAGLKRVVELTVDGEIGPEQALKISMSVDRGAWAEVRSPSDVTNDKHAVEGDGDYVDRSQSVDVGAYTLGRGEIGGGTAGLTAYHYRRTLRIVLDKFEYVKFRVEAMKLGYASVTEFTYRDIRIKSQRVPNRYRVGR